MYPRTGFVRLIPQSPPQCDAATALITDMPCLDGWTDVHASSSAATALALLQAPGRRPNPACRLVFYTQSAGCLVADAWGSTLYLANGNDSTGGPLGANYATVPYRMAFKSTTPWGQDIVIYAVQTL